MIISCTRWHIFTDVSRSDFDRTSLFWLVTSKNRDCALLPQPVLAVPLVTEVLAALIKLLLCIPRDFKLTERSPVLLPLVGPAMRQNNSNGFGRYRANP